MKFIPRKLNIDESELISPDDLMTDVAKELANKVVKKREELIIDVFKKHGFTFQNAHQLYEILKRCERIIHNYDTINELWYENECICMWDEKTDIDYENYKIIVTHKFTNLKDNEL